MPPKTDRIQDDALRSAMEEAAAALKSGDYKRVVELSAESYSEFLRRRPEMLEGAAQLRNVLFFPRLGARLQLDSRGQPEVVWDRERFSFSEAITYYEFAVDSLVKNGA